MTGPAAAVSVVVVSRDRPQSLRRCILGLSQLRYSPFEIVVVTDAAGRSVLREIPQAAPAKIIAFDTANISEARNLGIAHANGEIIAFIDDDAVPEPSWLLHLIAPFHYPEVAAAAGFVRGRNGISWQWQAETVDRTGLSQPLEVDPVQPTLLTASAQQTVKTQGTNMAFRRDVLVELGGFDPNYRFYLDDTDLNLRMAARGATTAVVPMAQVHHGFAESDRRRADRVPRDLRQIGASWAVFLRRHCPTQQRTATWARVQAAERKRLLEHMVAGRLEPRDVRALLRGLRAGYRQGLERRQTLFRPITQVSDSFAAYPATQAQSVVVAGHRGQSRRLRQLAKQHVASGRITTLMLFSRSTLYHQVRFSQDGIWEQTGGQFGRSTRTQPAFEFWRLGHRVQAETDRVRDVRLIET